MEKILTDKVNYLSDKGYEITIVTTEQKGRDIVYPLHSSVKTIDLDVGYEDNNEGTFLSKFVNYPIKQKKHKDLLSEVLYKEHPDVAVSMFCGEERFLADIKDGSRKIIEVHFSRFKRIQYSRKGIWGLSDRIRSFVDAKVIGKFDKFVALTQEDLEYWGNPSNGIVIPNFVSSYPDTASDLSAKTVLAVGRLSYQKGFDRLITAWKNVCDACLDVGGDGWILRLVGDGECMDNLKQQALDLGIEKRVVFSGQQKDMDKVYRDASILALSSHYEGMPMVLMEAQAYGIPIVSFDCKCGPKDIVANNVDGFLVKEGDVDGLADAITELIKNEQLRMDMGLKAREHSLEWDKKSIMDKWQKVLEGRL